MSGLLELEQAREVVLDHARALPAERVRLDAALGRTLAADAIAAEAVPAYDNSAMDGFAVRAADVAGAGAGTTVTLRLIGESRAGSPAGVPVAEGETVGVSTGAVMPAGADAVVPCEQAVAGSAAVVVEVAPAPGAWIRRAGDDFAAGAIVVTAGTRLGPSELGVLAAVGGAEVSCTRRPRVAVMTTGDELVAPGGQMYPGAVRDASAHSIPALARCAGAEVVTCAHVGDDREAIAATLHDILGVDAVVVCGGASVGEHDHVRSAAATEGVRELFWGVALKPGKPTWFGVRGDTLVFGLPGNPVSSMVTFILLCAPALRALSGSQSRPLRAVATLTADYEKEPGRAHAVRCRAHVGEDGWEVEPTGPQGSHILTSMLGASALAIIPSASGSVSAGTRVEIELLASIWPEQLAAPAGGDAA